MINAVDLNDAGNYTCYVSNVAGTKSISVMLNVAGACDVTTILVLASPSSPSSSYMF